MNGGDDFFGSGVDDFKGLAILTFHKLVIDESVVTGMVVSNITSRRGYECGVGT